MIDSVLGYQTKETWFKTRQVQAWCKIRMKSKLGPRPELNVHVGDGHYISISRKVFGHEEITTKIQKKIIQRIGFCISSSALKEKEDVAYLEHYETGFLNLQN
ncbi:hypothetical protein CEXT_459871 [Caerostris extrusa]|uniref:Uncharacterized protein n=1 Tax=Caerostris extrusa TaxID=172846 RepID=A0AAV4UDI3_CAEEX|nr:hypothetical protein CEXT_459871 [Caerostris extrusa]